MALDYSQTWTDTAKKGVVKPVLLLKLGIIPLEQMNDKG